MALAPGARIVPNDITAQIGEGGPPPLNAVFGRSYGEVSPKLNWRPRP